MSESHSNAPQALAPCLTCQLGLGTRQVWRRLKSCSWPQLSWKLQAKPLHDTALRVWTEFRAATKFRRVQAGGLDFGAEGLGDWLADMQVLPSQMQKNCSRCKVFAPGAAKPACRPAIFTCRPDRLLFTSLLCYYFISIRFQAGGSVSQAAKPACWPAIFTGRPDYLLFCYFTISFPVGSRQKVFASRAAKPACRPAMFTGRPDRLLFYYFTV